MAKSNIKFVIESECKLTDGKIYDVYYTKKNATYMSDELPKSVKRFIRDAELHIERGTEIIHRNEAA